MKEATRITLFISMTVIMAIAVIIASFVCKDTTKEELYGHIINFGEENVYRVRGEGFLVIDKGKMYYQAPSSVGMKEEDNKPYRFYREEVKIAENLKK